MSEIKDITNLDSERESGLASLKNAIPPNIRLFVADLLGQKEKFTEKDLSPEYRDLLKEIAIYRTQSGEKRAPKKTIDYYDYKVDSYGRPLLQNMMDPRYNLKTLLGKAKVELTKDGDLVVKDSFDFNDKKDVKNLEDFKAAIKDIYEKTKGDGLYQGIRTLGKYFGSGPGEGIPVEINLGKYKNI